MCILIPYLCPWVKGWGTAFDVSVENVFHCCKPSSYLENIFHWFDCLYSDSVCWQRKRYVGIRKVAVSLQRLPHNKFTGSKIIFIFITIWSCSRCLLDSEDIPIPYSLTEWYAKYASFDSALWLLYFIKIPCNLQLGKLECGCRADTRNFTSCW